MFKIVNSRKSDNTLINPHVTHTAKTLESALRWAKFMREEKNYSLDFLWIPVESGTSVKAAIVFSEAGESAWASAANEIGYMSVETIMIDPFNPQGLTVRHYSRSPNGGELIVDDPDHYDEDTADIILSRISPA